MSRHRLAVPMLLILPLLLAAAKAGKEEKKKDEPKDVVSADTLSGLELRGIGPALTSGRIVDIAVSPVPGTYYVAAASGGVWKTTTWGATFTPIFEGEGSYSIGCVTVDPKDPMTVWVGSGENNSQRSVGYGDGVYKSVDGGKNFENVGLKASEHIGKIVVDPRDSKVVWVAAQGPLWKDGGDRGLYRTADAGATWKKVLDVSPKTGISDLWIDPRNPDVLYATSYQRRRHVWTLIDGGPESALHLSRDGGATWRKAKNGFPSGDLGRIGLAVSPANPDVVYAIVEASDSKVRGVYRSTDAGANWERRGDYNPTSPQYYQELVPDPKNVERVYAMDTFMKVSEDGGATFKNVGERDKHVDNHALWIDPADTDHLLNGNDGGLYESWDRGKSWQFKPNLPVTQFYRVAIDQARPFYNVYGGTQDNFSLGGPSRTATDHGIVNADWTIVLGGDGFEPQVDPVDPDIVYAEAQNGALARYDHKTGEKLDIQPQPAPGEDPLRWNWDSALIISPHSHTRLYFGAQRLFRSDDRGDTWRAVSPDLTAQIDRNKLKVMDRVWSVDAVAKSASTSFYGNIVSLAESPRVEGLLYVGTDDGNLQVSEDGGGAWRKTDTFPGVPARTYVSDLEPSPHDDGTVYAAFDAHKSGDFKPYLLKSADRGRTWTSVAGDLPERGTVYTVAEDRKTRGLLYAGTEFGLYVSREAGKWIRLKGGLPTIPIRDLEIQAREDDLVMASFGRGFFILDDLEPLRRATREVLEREATLFPVRDARMYIPREPLGLPGRAFQGASFFSAPNPPFGAVITYYLKDAVKTRKEKRREEEKKVAEKGGDVFYPTWEALDAEEHEEDPEIVLTVKDEAGGVVRRLTGPVSAGFHRVAWDLRYPPADPTSLTPPSGDNPFDSPPIGPLATPGTYTVTMEKRVEGKLVALGEPQTIRAQVLGASSLPAADRDAMLAFQKKTARLQRAVLGAGNALDEARQRVAHLKRALTDTPSADPALASDVRALEPRLDAIGVKLTGGGVKARHNEPEAPSITDRVQTVIGGQWTTTSAPTTTQKQGYEYAAAAFEPVLADLKRLVEVDLQSIERRAEAAGAPWTPGRIPDWKKE